LKTYKAIALTLVSLITLAVVIFAAISVFKFKQFYQLLVVPVYIVLAVQAIPAIIKIKNISYDEGAVYYDKKGFEVQIPFEDIRDIEIKTLSGIYKINLYFLPRMGNIFCSRLHYGTHSISESRMRK
jgi:hypothetical protein